jgi:uncharacterized protein (DUF2236 family)
MAVTRADLEHGLTRLRGMVTDPRAGIFERESISWEINRELGVFVAGGRAALLQLAHPFVAHAVDQHSETRHDPLGRFRRTFDQVGAMSFGDLDHAIAAARRVHAIHTRIFGSIPESVGPFSPGDPYLANDESALVWVYATLTESAVRGFELVVRRLCAEERERYYRESLRFALLFGIREEALPPDWAAFEAYNERMWHWLAVASPARDMARFLLSPRALRPPRFATWYRCLTAGLMPEPLRRPFGLRFEAADRRAFERSIRGLRLVRRALPPALRYVPAYLDARRRLGGKTGRDPLAVLVERYVFYGPIARSVE